MESKNLFQRYPKINNERKEIAQGKAIILCAINFGGLVIEEEKEVKKLIFN